MSAIASTTRVVPSHRAGTKRARPSRITSGSGRLRGAPAAVFWLLVGVVFGLPFVLLPAVALSPRLVGQGSRWVTLDAFGLALRGPQAQGLLNSLVVGGAAAVAAAALGCVACWLVLRTDLPGRRIWTGAMIAVLLAPSYLIATGFERLLAPAGVLDLLGASPRSLQGAFYGPVGVAAVLTLKGVPFAYLAISAAWQARGEWAHCAAAVRVHGGGAIAATRLSVRLLGPAVCSAMAVVFAESIGDFGVAATLARDAHYPLATLVVANAAGAAPEQFPVAAAVGWLLMSMAGLALLVQSRVLRGRGSRVHNGTGRSVRRRRLGRAATLGAVAAMGALLLLSLGVPVGAAIFASVEYPGPAAVGHGLTLAGYRHVLGDATLRDTVLYSAKLATVTATVTVLVAILAARLLVGQLGHRAARIRNLPLLTAVAVPGIVVAVVWLLTADLLLGNRTGTRLHQTATLLVVGYLVSTLPSAARVLRGAVPVIHHAGRGAARVHGLGALGCWLRAVLPVLTRPLVAAWVLTFAITLVELPVSVLLHPHDHAPVSVGITHALSNSDFAGGAALEVIAVFLAVAVAGLTWLAFRFLAPRGWRLSGQSA